MAVASPSTVGLVAMMTSETPPAEIGSEQLLDTKLLGTDAPQGGNHAVQDVVGRFEFVGALQRHDVPRVLNHADDRTVPGLIAADGAQLLVGQVAAHLAVMDFFMGFQNGRRQRPWPPCPAAGAQNRPAAGPTSGRCGQPFKLLDQTERGATLYPGHG